jgi:hypothetical protein
VNDIIEGLGKVRYIKIKGNRYGLFKILWKDLLVIDNPRFKTNKRWNSYKDLLSKDVKKAKDTKYDYNRIGSRIFRIAASKFIELLIKDLCDNGDYFKLPTKYGDLFIGPQLVNSKSYSGKYGFKELKLTMFSERLFWEPYPNSFNYRITFKKNRKKEIKKTSIEYEQLQIYYSENNLR